MRFSDELCDRFPVLRRLGNAHESLGVDGSVVPQLVFDMRALRRNFLSLEKIAANTGARFLFAVKSFPSAEILVLAQAHLGGFDVSNATEVDLVRSATRGGGDAKACAMSLFQPCSDAMALQPLDAWVEEKARAGSPLIVSCESASQVASLQDCYGEHVRISVRINSPSLLASADRGDPLSPGFLWSRFGAWGGVDELRDCVLAAGTSFEGFHLHHGFPRANGPGEYTAFARAAASLARDLGVSLPCVNFGGGLSRFSNDDLGALVGKLREGLPPETRIVFEPGRLLTRDAGFAVGHVRTARTVRIPTTDGAVTRLVRVVSLSRSCHMKWSNPALLGAFARAQTVRSPVRLEVVGPTCYEDDVLASVALATPVAENEFLPAGSSIAFGGITGYSVAWNTSFNGIPSAMVRFVD